MPNFVAIDFETANYAGTSACAVGLAIVEKGEITAVFHTLIRPEPFWFVPEFTALHGISEEDVENAKSFGEVWPEIHRRIKGRSLLAHNAPFDRGVLRACLNLHGIKFPQPEFVCTVRLARAAFPEYPDHKLNTVCSRLAIRLEHHQADSDAVACAKAAIHICRVKGVELARGRLKPKPDWHG